MYPCVRVSTCIRFRFGMRMLCILAVSPFNDWPACNGMYEASPIQCVQGHLQAYAYARVVFVFRCSSIGGTGISVNNVREILSSRIPHKPAVTTTPNYRYSLNQVSNPRYQTGVKPQPRFKPQLWNWPLMFHDDVLQMLTNQFMYTTCSN